MNNIISSFGYGIIQDCAGLLYTLDKEGISHSDFILFVEESKKKINGMIPKSVVKPKKKKAKPKNGKNIFLKSGEIELMKGVVCKKCKGVVYIEGICPSNPLVQQGFVRRGICGECGAEFGIR